MEDDEYATFILRVGSARHKLAVERGCELGEIPTVEACRRLIEDTPTNLRANAADASGEKAVSLTRDAGKTLLRGTANGLDDVARFAL